MKILNVFFLIVFSYGIISASAVALNLNFGTDNPTAGQTINFTASCNVAFFDPMDGTTPFNVTPASMTFTYVYNSPGNYTPQIACGVDMGSTPTYTNASNVILPSIPVGAATSSVSAIPTLEEWGLVIMGIIILGIGLVSMKQKNAVLNITKK